MHVVAVATVTIEFGVENRIPIGIVAHKSIAHWMLVARDRRQTTKHTQEATFMTNRARVMTECPRSVSVCVCVARCVDVSTTPENQEVHVNKSIVQLRKQ